MGNKLFHYQEWICRVNVTFSTQHEIQSNSLWQNIAKCLSARKLSASFRHYSRRIFECTHSPYFAPSSQRLVPRRATSPHLWDCDDNNKLFSRLPTRAKWPFQQKWTMQQSLCALNGSAPPRMSWATGSDSPTGRATNVFLFFSQRPVKYSANLITSEHA